MSCAIFCCSLSGLNYYWGWGGMGKEHWMWGVWMMYRVHWGPFPMVVVCRGVVSIIAIRYQCLSFYILVWPFQSCCFVWRIAVVAAAVVGDVFDCVFECVFVVWSLRCVDFIDVFGVVVIVVFNESIARLICVGMVKFIQTKLDK